MEGSDVELDLQRSVQAVLRELSTPATTLQSNQGMWRWSLHKKVDRDPAKSPVLVRILLRELEKAEGEDHQHVLIPLLHTLMYVLTKATGVPEELYQRSYTLCTRLLTLPAPYCTVALDCAVQLKTETAVPGTLYQRMVIAEQNLRSELYPYQERVLLFVDPELVSASVCSALLLEIQAAQEQQSPEACMRHVVAHALQAALGEACHIGAVHRKLQASSRRILEHYFHAVVAAVEQVSVGEASEGQAAGHLQRLEEIYRSLLGPAEVARARCAAHTLQKTCHAHLLPHSALTVLFYNLRKQESQKFCLTPRLSLQLYYIPVLAPQDPTASRQPELGDLATFLGRADPWYQSTVNTLCPAIHKLAEMPPCLDTSQTVDPFILDAITYYVRMGTQPIYFQIYRVKIFSDLSQEPTEDIFLTELKMKIHEPKPPKEGASPRRRGAAESLGAELSLCYQKALLSHRHQEVAISLRATGLVLKAIPASDTEVLGFPHCPPVAASAMDHMCLNVSVAEVVKSCHLAGRSFSMATNTFRTSSIQVQSQDHRPLMLWLDKDNQRTFKDVVRFEVDPCPEPCSRSQRSKTPWPNPEEQKAMEQTETTSKPLQMPINTYSGIVQ
ncbi:PREDICTED: LOW QUALITY PROTEIN: phosphoinositide 3-kinase regulatory subunit 6 [Dipodomys ordii]|uniref:LOW QUALITY PROTEIN: phosphoinositide 3-kinase regulatory subunit 6 n=1 Tax=Dipodomys ordii TaxID=10020 RepID=A0A1S3EYP9_DIPOR|nr:PREDICTED: LOW QUALITY PROTEIN: phosphoinositide 3-kinase regulatory subunit 6 [Dipodomys ordii]